MINLHDLGVKFGSKAHNECIRHAQMLCNLTPNRHIRRRHNTIKQLLSIGLISLDYVKSKDNIMDPLTKGLNRELVEKVIEWNETKSHKRISRFSGHST